MKLTTKYSLRIYDDDSGDYIEIRPNGDGVPGLIDIAMVAQGRTEGSLVMTDEQADALIDGLKRFKELNGPKTKMEWFMGPPMPQPQPGASPFPTPGVHIQALAHHNK